MLSLSSPTLAFTSLARDPCAGAGSSATSDRAQEQHNPPSPVVPFPSLDTLSQTLSSVLGAQLAAAIRQSRARASLNGRPIPVEIRRKLAPFFPEVMLQHVRYATNWSTIVEGTLPHLLFESGAVDAITLADIILFRSEERASDPLLWAHELVHVEQYHRLGIDAFATHYVQRAWEMENEAIRKANVIKERDFPGNAFRESEGRNKSLPPLF